MGIWRRTEAALFSESHPRATIETSRPRCKQRSRCFTGSTAHSVVHTHIHREMGRVACCCCAGTFEVNVAAWFFLSSSSTIIFEWRAGCAAVSPRAQPVAVSFFFQLASGTVETYGALMTGLARLSATSRQTDNPLTSIRKPL